MGVEAILLRYLVVISGVELATEKSANKTNTDGLIVRQRYDKNLIRDLCVFIGQLSAKVER